MQQGLVARVGERAQDRTLVVGRVAEQAEGLVGMGGDDDGVGRVPLTVVVDQLDAVGWRVTARMPVPVSTPLSPLAACST